VGQRSQASAAMRLLNQAGREMGATPPPLQATPARSGPARLGQAWQVRSGPLPPPASRAARPPPPGEQRRICKPSRAARQARPIAPVPQPDGGLGGAHSSAPARPAAGLKARWIVFSADPQRGAGWRRSKVSTLWTRLRGRSCISRTDYRSWGDTWESHGRLAGYSPDTRRR
jgi:hypothetical protein